MKIYIYDSQYDKDFEKDIRYNLFDQYAEEEGWNNICDISDKRVQEEINFLNEHYLEDTVEEMKTFFKDKMLLAFGYVGTWRGKLAAGSIIDADNIYKCWNNCDDISIYDDKGHLFIKSSHHDGTDIFEIKILTDKGCAKYNKWEDNLSSSLSEKEIHEKLWNNTYYTHIPHFAKKVYGCKTR